MIVKSAEILIKTIASSV